MPDERCIFCDARVQNVPSQHSAIVRLLEMTPSPQGMFQIVHAADRTYCKAVDRRKLSPAAKRDLRLYDEHDCQAREASF
jgi:hypothetical protein